MSKASSPLNYCVCSVCNYDMRGIERCEDGRITCPECGIVLKPKDPDSILTIKKIHVYFLFRLAFPTATPAVGLLLISWIPNISLFLGLIHTPLMFLLCTILWIVVSTKLVNEASTYPRPMPRWAIPLLGLLYIIPAVALTYIYWKIGFYFMIPV